MRRNSLSRSFSTRRRRAHGHGLVLVCILQRRITINGRTYRREKMTFWWQIYVACHFVIIWKCDLSRICQNRNYWKLKLPFNFICKSIFLFLTVRLCVSARIGSFYMPFITIYWLLRKKRTIFVNFYKCFNWLIKFIQIVFTYKWHTIH